MMWKIRQKQNQCLSRRWKMRKEPRYWYFLSGGSLQGVGEDRDRETEDPVGWTLGGTAPNVDRGVSLLLPTPFTLLSMDYSSGGQNPTLTLDSVGWRLVCLPISKVLYEIILIQTEEMKLGGWGVGQGRKTTSYQFQDRRLWWKEF